jgi:uracil-DNA glycosylase
MAVRPDGPIPARVMLVGEAPGAEEEAQGVPFVGASGIELNRMLHEAGMSRSEVFVTNVARERPPGNDIDCYIAKTKKDRTPFHVLYRDRYVTRQIVDGTILLNREIREVKPNVIIPVGNVSMWALTGKWGITKWRGSMLTAPEYPGVAIVPTYHPAAVLRQWDWRAIAVNDLRRAARLRSAPLQRPQWQFIVRPSFPQVIQTLDQLYVRAHHRDPLRISFDIETRSGHIACAGLSWSLTQALCIPFMCVGRPEGYWPEDEEAEIVCRLHRLLTHPNTHVVGQNLLYDAQYTWRHWHFVPHITQDTMISQHAIFSDLPKSLGFLASMYCDYYVYWKDEGKDWDKGLGEDQLWIYNCQDCVYTGEVADEELHAVRRMGLGRVHDAQQKMFWPVLQAMQRGVRVDANRRKELILEVRHEIDLRETFITEILGHPLNPRSPKQMSSLFYEDFAQQKVMTRATKTEPARPTLNDEALQKIAAREPLLKPLITAISDIRTLGVFLSNFLERPLDRDGRMRCAYNIGGSASGKSAPKTYRLSSSENAFGSGGNLQNIPSAKSKSLGKAKARGTIPALGDPYSFPNIRAMFVPDPGYLWFEGDLDRADLQVVAWEAQDESLKTALRAGADIHLLNAFILEGRDPPPMDGLVEGHPAYAGYRKSFEYTREFAKVFCHATNYGGGARTVAAAVGRSVAEVERCQRLWFAAHPGIRRWHERVLLQLREHRYVENKFGYRWYVFDRLDAVASEAIAWVPQSTVSIVINKIWMAIYEQLPEVQVLLQVHDSLCGQVPLAAAKSLLPRILELSRIVVPYQDPLTIPFTLKVSETSWGDVRDYVKELQ